MPSKTKGTNSGVMTPAEKNAGFGSTPNQSPGRN